MPTGQTLASSSTTSRHIEIVEGESTERAEVLARYVFSCSTEAREKPHLEIVRRKRHGDRTPAAAPATARRVVSRETVRLRTWKRSEDGSPYSRNTRHRNAGRPLDRSVRRPVGNGLKSGSRSEGFADEAVPAAAGAERRRAKATGTGFVRPSPNCSTSMLSTVALPPPTN